MRIPISVLALKKQLDGRGGFQGVVGDGGLGGCVGTHKQDGGPDCRNRASHEAVTEEKLLFITLPLITTAVFQPLDAGEIECLKRRYQRRILEGLIRFHTPSLGMAVGTANPVNFGGKRPRQPTRRRTRHPGGVGTRQSSVNSAVLPPGRLPSGQHCGAPACPIC